MFSRWWKATLLASVVVIAVTLNFRWKTEQQFTYLAESFLQGKAYFLDKPSGWVDAILWEGKFYWPLGPMPAVLLTPFAATSQMGGWRFYQGFLMPFLNGVIFLFCFRLARHFGYSRSDSAWWGVGFMFASVYMLMVFVPWSWYLAQVVATLMLFLAIYEWMGRRSYWVIGIFLAAAFATRGSVVLGGIFFLLGIWHEVPGIKAKLISCLKMGLPLAVMMGLLWLYNYVRFSRWNIDTFAICCNAELADADRYELLHYGTMQLRNIPTNFYYYFIKTLDPIRETFTSMRGATYVLKFPYVKAGFPGAGFFVVSPIFLWLIKANWRSRMVKWAGVTSLVILITILSWWWPGWRQIGPRYMIDLLPYLFLILLTAFPNRKLTWGFKVVLLLSVGLNFYLLGTIFSEY